MAIRKFGAPASSHVRLITAEDVETMAAASAELSKVGTEEPTTEQETNESKESPATESEESGL